MGISDVQEVPHSQLDALIISPNTNFGDGIHIDTDKVQRGNVAIGFDVHGNLTDNQLIDTLQKRNADTSTTNEDFGLLAKTGDDIRHIGWSLDIPQNTDDEDRNHDNCGDENSLVPKNQVKHSFSPLSI